MRIYIGKVLAAICFLTLLFSACNKNTDPISKIGFYFDTVITITVYDSADEKYIEDCFALAEKYENLFSKTRKGSDIYRINNANGEMEFVDEETVLLIKKGLEYREIGKETFDITIGALSSLWDFKKNDNSIPTQEDIDSAKLTMNAEIYCTDRSVTISNPNTQLDLGGIAKGYIADKMKEHLVEQGVSKAIINLGGNLLCIGEKEDGIPFKFGIQSPFSEEGKSIAVVNASNQSVVTSGIYERYFEVDNTIYHHIIDTSTGYPVENDLASATIICDSSADADALSTICFALGLKEGIALIETMEHTEAVFVTKDLEVHKTSSIEIFQNADNP